MYTSLQDQQQPKKEVTTQETPKSESPKKNISGQKKILIAEDEKPLSKALQLKLTNEGFNVEIASNGQEALELLEKEPKDILVLDLVMPVLDGFGVLQSLKEKGSKMPIIVLSNLSQNEDIDKVNQLGATKFYIKSNTSLAELVEHIKELVA